MGQAADDVVVDARKREREREEKEKEKTLKKNSSSHRFFFFSFSLPRLRFQRRCGTSETKKKRRIDFFSFSRGQRRVTGIEDGGRRGASTGNGDRRHHESLQGRRRRHGIRMFPSGHCDHWRHVMAHIGSRWA